MTCSETNAASPADVSEQADFPAIGTWSALRVVLEFTGCRRSRERTAPAGSRMTPHQAYRKTAQSGWTRIEMLLAIYDATIASLDNGIDALNQNRLETFPALQLRSSQLCLLIISGIDSNASEVAGNLRNLCMFCMDQISQPDLHAWTSARNVLETIREGFLAIKDQGIQLEAAGSITQLPRDTAQTLMHS